MLKNYGVDLIDCSSGGIKGPNSLFSLASTKPPTPGFQVPFAKEIRKKCDIATMAVGMILDPRQANQIINSGEADLIALGREHYLILIGHFMLFENSGMKGLMIGRRILVGG